MLQNYSRIGVSLSRCGSNVIAKSQYASAAAATSLRLKAYDEIPGPKQWPMVGSMLSTKELGSGIYEIGNYPKFVDDLHRDFGDLVKWKTFNVREVFTYNPEHVKLLIASEDAWPFRPYALPWEIYAKRHNFPSALVNSQGEFWKAQRSATNPIMARPQRVLSYLTTQNEIIDEFIQIIKEDLKKAGDQTVTIKKFQNRIKYLNLELMGLVSFDRRLNALTDDRPAIYRNLVEDIEEYSILTAKLMYGVPTYLYISTKTWRDFEACSHRIFGLVRNIVQEEYEKLNASKEENEGRTMLQQFLINKKKSNLDMTIIVSVMSELLLAAFDTTSINLHFMLYELGRNAEVQNEVYQDIMKNYSQESTTDAVTEETLGNIKLLKASLKETQRLHPLAPINSRVLSKDIVFDGHVIPAGTSINLGFETMSKSERLFKDAIKFNPKRWTSEKEDASKLISYASMPFGFGARMCIGRRLAEQNIFTFMTKLLKNFKVEYEGKETKSVFRLVNAPDQDLDLKVSKRA